VDVEKGQGVALKAFEFAGGHKQEDRCPSIGDMLDNDNIVSMENFHNNFG